MQERSSRILIVEDNELWSESFKQWIGDWDYRKFPMGWGC
jgi:hypothetical protein